MNKKGIETDLLIGLISFAIILGIIFILTYNIGGILGAQTNTEAVNNWVKARSLTQGVALPQVPPVPDLEDPLVIKNKEDLMWEGDEPPKAYKEIATSMVNCWNAFDRGTRDFIQSTEKEVFCFPCRAIKFSDEIKDDKIEMSRFNYYLNSTHVAGQNSQTFLQVLSNDQNYVMTEDELADDKIIADKNLHIFMVAASGRGMVNLITTALGFGDVVDDVENTKLFKPAEVSSPIVPQSEDFFTGPEKGELILATEGVVAGTRITQTTKRYLVPKLTQALQDQALKATSLKGIDPMANNYLETALGEDVSRLAVKVETRAGGEAAKLATERGLARIITGTGLRLIGRLNLFADAVLIGAGVYELTFGENPFAAKIALAYPEEVTRVCN